MFGEDGENLFKKLFFPGGSAGFDKVVDSKETVFIKKTSTTIIKINVNGKEQTLQLTGDMDQNAINQMISQLGVNAEEMQGVLEQLKQHIGVPAGAADSAVEQLNAPAEKVLCPECRHTVASNRPCMYCGHVFAREKAPEKQKAADEVDRRILEHDVKGEQKTEEKQQQKNENSFKNRLEGI